MTQWLMDMIGRSSLLGEVVYTNPEVAPILTEAGLHCIGCHVSQYETIEDGCRGHGMPDEHIDELVRLANERIQLYETLPRIAFTKAAAEKLKEKASAAKAPYVKIVQTYGGEFDFEPTTVKEVTSIEVPAGDSKVLVDQKIERMLRGLEIDYDPKAKDFTARQAKIEEKKESAVPEKKAKK